MAKPAVAPKVQKHQGRIFLQLYTPHAAQRKFHNSKARFRVIAAGRRVGKTLGVANELVKFAVDHPGTNNVWVSPVYRQCKVVYRLLRKALREIITYSSDTEMRLELCNTSVIEFYSATNPDTIRGNGFDFFVLDECQDIDAVVWFDCIRPTLSSSKTGGRGIFIGTPKGRNFFYQLFCKGNDPLEEDWASFTFPSSANPYIPASEIEAARRDLPEDNFRQEYLAVFLERASGVFRGVEACIQGDVEEILPGQCYRSHPPVSKQFYVIGFDIAKHQDFSVITVLNAETRHVDFWYRTNQVDYTVQIEKVAYISAMYNDAPILQDATGVGDAVLEMLIAKGLSVEGYVYTNLSKKLLIEGLQVAIEHTEISFPAIPVLIHELSMMQYKLSPSRLLQYEAPPGHHDDAVNSLALARMALGNGGTGIPLAVSGQTKLTAQELDPDNIMYTERDDVSDALLERQSQVLRLLGDVNLIAEYGN